MGSAHKGLNNRTAIVVMVLFMLSGCTGQIPGSFRFLQQVQAFSSQQNINTKLDLLWVVDNSSSMDVSQSKLREGFESFAGRYMKPTWDIRVAVITTDTYLANPAFSGYLNRVVPGSVGYVSSYIQGRLGTFQNPVWNPTLVNLSTGAMDAGIKYGELIPALGPSYARLLAGVHDGPISSFCFEGMPYFFNGVTQCTIRDNQSLYTGSSQCINPSGGLSSLSQCVNTVQNDSVHSSKPIISTMPPAGTPGDSAWTQALVNNFVVNASVGSSGSGSERGLSSILQFLNDNEPSATAFFRPGSLRGIIFLTDEDDQSLEIPSSPDPNFSPMSQYKCDQATLVGLNGSSSITGSGGMCCSVPSNNCRYGSLGTSCGAITVDSYTYSLGICADTSQLIPVEGVKTTLDTFFRTLDQNPDGEPNYFIAVITPTNETAVQTLQAQREATNTSLGLIKVPEVAKGDRYLALADAVGSNSLALDISASDYSPVLDAIGQQIVARKSTFTLTRAPTSKDDMLVSIIHADGSETVVPSDLYTISGKNLIFTDQDFVLSFSSTDQVVINYQPKTAK